MKIILGKQFFTCNSILKELVELAMRLMAPLVAAIILFKTHHDLRRRNGCRSSRKNG
jgi:hypothetical protein